jgi:hypothetical protein
MPLFKTRLSVLRAEREWSQVNLATYAGTALGNVMRRLPFGKIVQPNSKTRICATAVTRRLASSWKAGVNAETTNGNIESWWDKM